MTKVMPCFIPAAGHSPAHKSLGGRILAPYRHRREIPASLADFIVRHSRTRITPADKFNRGHRLNQRGIEGHDLGDFEDGALSEESHVLSEVRETVAPRSEKDPGPECSITSLFSDHPPDAGRDNRIWSDSADGR